MARDDAFDAKEQVRRAIDIVELVGQYVQLRREGRIYKGLCPWHDDSRPSLQVNPERQSFKCFVCNIGGDVFNFIMKYENVAFPEALAMLAERAGIALKSSPRSSDDKRLLFQAMAWAEQQFHDCLLSSPEAEAARKYLVERGITAESIRQFHLGFSPDRWDWLLSRARETRFTPKVLETIGLAVPRQSGQGHYDRFRGRVLFSIRDVQGRPVAAGGRLLPGPAKVSGSEFQAPGQPQTWNLKPETGSPAKYINSPETPIFSKSNLLYGLDLAKDAVTENRRAIVMEGYTDCLIAQQCGIKNAVAVLGTALGERHIGLLRRFTDQVLLVLDGDEAGRRRTDQILELFVAAQVDLLILTLPDELDPADFLLRQGPEAFSQLLEGAADALEHKFRLVTAGLDAHSGTHAVNRALEEMLTTLARTPRLNERTETGAKLKESQILSRLAHRFKLTEEALWKRLCAMRNLKNRKSEIGNRKSEPPQQPASPQPAAVIGKFEIAVRELLAVVIRFPDHLPRVRDELRADEIKPPPWRELYERCCQLADAGTEPNFERLLLEIEEPQLKTLLIELDELYLALGVDDSAARLEILLTAIRDYREAEQKLVRRMDANRRPSEQEKLDEVNQIIAKKRQRQGISAPTDG